MKKILLVMSVAIIMALFSAPSFVKAAEYEIGQALYYRYNNSGELITLYADTPGPYSHCYNSSGYIYVGSNIIVYYYRGSSPQAIVTAYVGSIFIDDLQSDADINYNGNIIPVHTNFDDFEEDLPENLQRTREEKLWDKFYDLYKSVFGYYPSPDSIIGLIRDYALGDDTEDTEIIFPTLDPTPTPTPTPTPIPVQTIFVPDGNGNTTIIYQYPDPTTGVITQSPYNPNIENNITVNCDCDGSGGSGDNIFGTNPQDPYTLTSSMLWADGFGVEMSENPLTAANDSQKTLAETASEYSDSVNVVSNSFNILPFKWLTLVGLLGGILIIAGLIRTFLGG